MRNITDITEEEIKQFLDATVITYKISKISKKEDRVVVEISSEWDSDMISDTLTFGQYRFDTGDFPGDFQSEYHLFQVAKGFIENPFIDANFYHASKVIESLKAIVDSNPEVYPCNSCVWCKARQTLSQLPKKKAGDFYDPSS